MLPFVSPRVNFVRPLLDIGGPTDVNSGNGLRLASGAGAGERAMQEWWPSKKITLATATLVWIFPLYALAGTSGGIYDMRALLNQPHPFHTQPPAATPTTEIINSPVAPPKDAMPVAPVRPASGGLARPSARAMPVAQSGARGEARASGWFGLSEIRAGILAHDQGIFSSHKESGADINFEALFTSPDLLKRIWSPRPQIGLNANTAGDTSQAYLGLSWQWDFWRNWFAGFSFGGAVHTGKTETTDLKRKELGCRVLFRESLEFGYRLTSKHGLSLFADHISNGKLCKNNEGLENFGLRYGYRF
jgi:lipid A 3-O-deacylase